MQCKAVSLTQVVVRSSLFLRIGSVKMSFFIYYYYFLIISRLLNLYTQKVMILIIVRSRELSKSSITFFLREVAVTADDVICIRTEMDSGEG